MDQILDLLLNTSHIESELKHLMPDNQDILTAGDLDLDLKVIVDLLLPQMHRRILQGPNFSERLRPMFEKVIYFPI